MRAAWQPAIAAFTVSPNLNVPGLDTLGVVSCATGTSATFTPPTVLAMVPLRPGTGAPLLVMLIAAQGYFDAFIWARKLSGPKSNSWLPGTAMSNGTRLVNSMVLAPLSKPDCNDGESMSPSKT